jgi:O-acetyl-ADP-ribose deacetylase (regulator of RNase III)
MSELVSSRMIGLCVVEVSIGDIADQPGFDAVVHPTTASMKPGGGAGGAIFARADGKALAKACGNAAPLEVTQSVLTPSFGLSSPNIIHCRGPRHGERESANELGTTLWNILEMAERSRFASIAIPAISCGAMGFPLDEAARIAVEAIKKFSPDFSNLRTIRFVLIDPSSAKSFADELSAPPRMPERRNRLDIPVLYSPREIQALRHGFIGDQTTKWFFYHEAPWLCVYRGSRTGGRCHFWLRLPDSLSPAPIAEAWMDTEVPSADSPWEKQQAEELLQHLLDDRFNLMSVAEHKESVGVVEFWVKRGKVALHCSLFEGQSLLTPEDARDLGHRLVELSETLTVAAHTPTQTRP